MTEPTTQVFSIAAFAVALLGPDYGPAAAILLASMAGAVWGVSSTPVTSRASGAGLFCRYTLTAVVLVGGGTALAHDQLAIKWHSPFDLSVIVAFCIAALGSRGTEILKKFNPLAKKSGGDK